MPGDGRPPGGGLHVVTKRGGNEFHRPPLLKFSPGALEGDRPQILAAGQTLSTDRKVDLVHDFGAELGGPILKDRLWFYGGISFNSTRIRIEQNLNRRILDAADPSGFKTDPVTGDFVTERIPGTQ